MEAKKFEEVIREMLRQKAEIKDSICNEKEKLRVKEINRKSR